MKNLVPKGIFVVDNKEANLKAIENIKKLLTITLSQVKALKENNKNQNLETKRLCEAIIKNIIGYLRISANLSITLYSRTFY